LGFILPARSTDVYAYHFVGEKLRDGRPIPPDGEWLVHEGEMVICESGLHASKRPMDALAYAPGRTLCLVECEDIVDEHADKFVCRRRKIVKRIDATELLWKASREFALSVIHLWDAPQVVRDFLTTGDESLRAAARAAAGAAAWDAARAAARAAAWAAAWDAARAAARAAAWDAARAAAWDAARAAAGDAARAAAWDAARAAAGDAAGAAAWDAQKEIMQRLVDDAFRGEA
jgi:hypothetical protein